MNKSTLRFLPSVLCLLSAVFLSGCISGQPVIGPLSYLSARHNEATLVTRVAAQSNQLQPVQKAKVFEAVNLSQRPNEMAAGIGVNVTDLLAGNYTWGELALQFSTITADAVAEFAAGKALYSAIKVSASSSASPAPAPSGKVPGTLGDANVVVSGNTAPVTINYGNSPVTTSSSTGP